MKTWRETKIGNGVKRPKSKQMHGLNNKENLGKKIKQQKEKQRKLFKIIREEMKKADQFRMSLEGLQDLSNSSVNSIQTKRERTIDKAKIAMSDLLENTRMLKQTENQYRKIP